MISNPTTPSPAPIPAFAPLLKPFDDEARDCAPSVFVGMIVLVPVELNSTVCADVDTTDDAEPVEEVGLVEDTEFVGVVELVEEGFVESVGFVVDEGFVEADVATEDMELGACVGAEEEAGTLGLVDAAEVTPRSSNSVP